MSSDQAGTHEQTQRGNQGEGSFFYRIVTSILLFGLLSEWLLPWTSAREWAVIYHPMPLLAIIGCMLAAGLFRMPWIMSFLVHTVICVLCLMWLYKGDEQSSIEWLVGLPGLIGDNVALMMRSGLWAMSGELRTLMLFAGWAMLAPALQALVWIRQASLGIAAVTLVYLGLLHVWLGMDILGGFIRTTVEGLLLAAIVTIPRVRRVLDISENRLRGMDKSWIAGATFITFVIAGGALLATVDRESELAPANWTTAMTNRLQEGINTIGGNGKAVATMKHMNTDQLGRALTGYGFDDSELGMPISTDDRILFKGLSPVRAYWRGESKSIYDGRGWSNAERPLTLKPVKGEEAGASTVAQLDGESLKGRVVEQTVVWENPAAEMPIFASGLDGEVTELIAADPRRKLGSFLVSDDTDALYAASETAKLSRYSVRSTLPITDANSLRALGGVGAVYADGGAGSVQEKAAAKVEKLTEEELKPFLQLPESLPGRVAALASEVAGAGMTNLYDRVKAVEVYLESTYAYTRAGSEVPPANVDFVDHFLFEQRQGYCVHFSTAMVVMLRSQGIPARWVKGFTSGDDTGELGETTAGAAVPSERIYEVRGSDAHAWVEVYMEGAGWVPFDPTPGYGGAATVAAAPGGDPGAASNADGSVPAGLAGGATGLARFEAAAEEAASMVRRAADALADGARSAWDAAEASPGAAAAAGGAALAAAAAALAAGQRRRLRLWRALRRYGAASEALARLAQQAAARGDGGASANAGAGAGGVARHGNAVRSAAHEHDNSIDRTSHIVLPERSTKRAQSGMKRSMQADRSGKYVGYVMDLLRRRLKRQVEPGMRSMRGANSSELVIAERQRSNLIRALELVVGKVLISSTSGNRIEQDAGALTLREIAAVAGEKLDEDRRMLLDQVVHWLEAARYEPPGTLRHAPQAQELSHVCRLLLKQIRTNKQLKHRAVAKGKKHQKSQAT
ncbi:transglutaminase family protein [Paenibacillus sp. strain BS8-2]